MRTQGTMNQLKTWPVVAALSAALVANSAFAVDDGLTAEMDLDATAMPFAAACPPGTPSTMNDYFYTDTWDYDSYDEPFVLGGERVNSEHGYSERLMKHGRLKATLRVYDSHQWENVAIHRIMAKAIAALPGTLVQRLPPIVLEITRRTYSSNSDNAFTVRSSAPPYTVQFPLRYVKIDNAGRPYVAHTASHRNFEELLAHELAHVIDYHAIHVFGVRWSISSGWVDAVDRSPCACRRTRDDTSGRTSRSRWLRGFSTTAGAVRCQRINGRGSRNAWARGSAS